MNSKILVFALSALGIVMAFFMGRAAGQGQLMHIALVFGILLANVLRRVQCAEELSTMIEIGTSEWAAKYGLECH
jgi:hypothetical protein